MKEFSIQHYFLVFLIKVSLCFLFLYIVRKRSRILTIVVLFIFMLVVLRAGILYNPFAWRFYKDTLHAPTAVEWRERSVISLKRALYCRSKAPVDFLALGTSQTSKIFGSIYRSVDPRVRVFALAGMGPLDFNLYEEEIFLENPRHIILYLTNYDLAKEPTFEASKLGPSPSYGLFIDIIKTVRIYYPNEWKRILPELHDMLVGKYFPEYKYAFLFRGLLNRYAGKVEYLNAKSSTEQSPDENAIQDEFERRCSLIRDEQDKRNIDFQLHYLNKFLESCDSKNIPVTILEGQYHPHVDTKRTLEIKRETARRVIKLASGFSNVTYFPASDLPSFSAGNYIEGDVVHVTPEAGVWYAKQVLSIIEGAHR